MARKLSSDGGRGYMERVPGALDRVLRGAARAGGRVIATEVKARANAEETRDNVTLRTKKEGNTISVRISVKRGWGLPRGWCARSQAE